MGSALVLGDRGSGLTTFVGLLYTAQVRLGTEDADEFRFHADRESLRRLEGIYVELGTGKFPNADIDWEEHPLSFVFGFRRGALGKIGHSGGSEEAEFAPVRVQVGGIPTDEIADLRDHDAVLDEPTRRLLRSPVLLPLIDATWLPQDPSAIAGLPIRRYDQLLAKTLELLGRFLSAEPRRRNRRMFPIFVVTKFDQIASEVLRALEAPSGPPAEWGSEGRSAVGLRLLQRYLPETAGFVQRQKTATLRVDSPVWFFSGLLTRESANGSLEILRRRRGDFGGWEPEYPFEEYRGLIEHLGRVAQRIPS
ncbi:MAG: hypothetical protein WB778_02080 [Thermoplasmata archaeon]